MSTDTAPDPFADMGQPDPAPSTWGRRAPGSGVPAVEWRVTEYGEYGEYEGHAFVTADPKGMGRSVCNGFIDDMAWIVTLHNQVAVPTTWRARLGRRLLGIAEPAWPVGASGETEQ